MTPSNQSADEIRTETWDSEKGKQAVITGILLAQERLHRDLFYVEDNELIDALRASKHLEHP